jgi:hypothetical protein
MSAYDELVNPEDKQEARDLAALAAQIVTWAGPASMSTDEALATAWKFLGETAVFISEQVVVTPSAGKASGARKKHGNED